MPNPLAPLLKPIGAAIGAAIFDRAVEWAKDPDNQEDAEKAVDWAIAKFTAATPWTWDDKVLNGLATRIASALKIPGLEGLSAAVAQLQQFVNRLPNLGGLLGGGR